MLNAKNYLELHAIKEKVTTTITPQRIGNSRGKDGTYLPFNIMQLEETTSVNCML